MNTDDSIFVAGHRGMVGAAIVALLKERGFTNIIVRSRAELDLINEVEVAKFYETTKPAYVIVAAAKVGGILANAQQPVEFLSQNLQIELNLIDGAYKAGVKKLLFLGSSCIYPKLAPQPLTEDSLLTSALEPTNEAYALAKIVGVKLCQAYTKEYGAAFISAMPTNLYGPGDNYDLQTSHVLPAMLRKFHAAKEQGAEQVTLWGTGSPLREFLHVGDLAEACLFLMEKYSDTQHVNVGSGQEISIRDLANMVKRTVGFAGEIVWDDSKPDGTPRKLLDTSKLASLGWSAQIPLESGVAGAYEWAVKHDFKTRQPE
jgi:GDP-L-fucose synthase